MVAQHDIVIIGGGCIGCAVARALTERSGLDVALVEKEHHLAAHQSGRNSGVLHPGFNYQPGSTKAEFATRGTRRLKTYAERNDIPLEEYGVLVLAQSDAEEERLHALAARADENGVETELLDGRSSIAEHEPHARGQAALYAPGAASIDAQQYVYTLAREMVAEGADLYMDTRFEECRRSGGTFVLSTSTGELEARYVVNAAGLYADRVARAFGVDTGHRVVPFRGEYYEVVPSMREVCRTMIYPTPRPELPFLGVHYTRRVDEKVIVGPNAVLALGREAYRNTDVDLKELANTLGFRGFRRLMADPEMLGIVKDELAKSYRKSAFVRAAQRLIPGIEAAHLRKSFSGIRAQLVSPDGELVTDPQFVHGEASTHVLNAVSPGLTSSLAVGEHLAGEVLDRVDR